MDANASFPPFDSQALISFDSADLNEKFATLPSSIVRRSNSTRSSLSLSTRSSTPTPSSPISSPSPAITILSLWPHATDSQIAFYTTGYATLYPASQILLLRDSRSLDPLLDTLTAPSEKPSLRAPTVMLHLFGHTGALHACALLRAYRARTSAPLNVGAIVSDTSPQITLQTLSTAPTLTAFFALLCALLLTLFTPSLRSSSADSIRADLTNPKFLPKGVRKCFVFAGQDAMFSWCGDGEGEAERRDYCVKRARVDVQGRWTGDQERYWMGVEGVWEGR